MLIDIIVHYQPVVGFLHLSQSNRPYADFDKSKIALNLG